MEYFRIGEALGFGWEKFRSHFFFLWMTLGTVFVISGACNALGKVTEKSALLSLLITLLSVYVGVIMEIGLTKLYLDVIDNDREGGIRTLFSERGLFFRYLGSSIVYGLVIAVGFLLLIIPGVYFILKYQFASYLIVDKGAVIGEAFKKSGEMTQGIKWQLLLFALAIGGINILGALVLGLGLLVTVPMTMMAYVFVYRKLSLRLVPAVLVSPTDTVVVAPEQLSV